MYKKPFPNDSSSRVNQVLQLVHANVVGPMKRLSIIGCKYFVSFTVDFSRSTWVYPFTEGFSV
eukprot:c30804_g1_i1 orf=98-286(+)